MTEEKLYVLRTQLFAPGVMYEGDDGSSRTVTAEAHSTAKLDGTLAIEKNHSDPMEGVHVLRTYKCPDTGLPMVEYAVTEDVREQIKSKSFKGVSPVIDATQLHEDTNDITDYELKGISFQFDNEAACSKDKCATTFVGGETMAEEETEELEETQEEETTEEKPKKVVKKKVVKAETKGSSKDLDAMAKMARELEQTKAKLKQYEEAEAERAEKRRKELLDMVDDDLKEHAEGLDLKALEKVVEMNKILAEKHKKETEDETVTEAGGEETSGKPKPGSEGEETTDEQTEEGSPGFFDKSGVLEYSPPPGKR